jgi:hypothetical protein
MTRVQHHIKICTCVRLFSFDEECKFCEEIFVSLISFLCASNLFLSCHDMKFSKTFEESYAGSQQISLAK